jgi:hypothetical protein
VGTRRSRGGSATVSGLLAEEHPLALSDGDLRPARLCSKLVHADGFLFNLDTIRLKSHSDLYGRLELLLRGSAKRCLLDKSFGEFFLMLLKLT